MTSPKATPGVTSFTTSNTIMPSTRRRDARPALEHAHQSESLPCDQIFI